MRRLIKAVRHAWVCLRMPYTVSTSFGTTVHRARTFKDALDWAKCYGGAEVCTIKRKGEFVALRYGRLVPMNAGEVTAC